jgi:hypothetical protein
MTRVFICDVHQLEIRPEELANGYHTYHFEDKFEDICKTCYELLREKNQRLEEAYDLKRRQEVLAYAESLKGKVQDAS